MAESVLDIGDYFALLNNLDGYETASDAEWPSLMTPRPTPITETSSVSPNRRKQQVVVPSKQLVTLQENRQNLSFKVCQTSVSTNSNTQRIPPTRMVVARQIDLSVQTTIKMIPELPQQTNRDDLNFHSASEEIRASESVVESFQSTPSSSSYGGQCSFVSSDSGFDSTESEERSSLLQVSNNMNVDNSNDSFQDKMTPRPLKRRRRTVLQALMAAKCKKVEEAPQTELNLDAFRATSLYQSQLQSSAANQNVSSQHNDSGIVMNISSDTENYPEAQKRTCSDDDVENEVSVKERKSTATGKRKRRAKIVRPNPEEFDEKVAAMLVGRLVIKQSIPKYRITYEELVRRVKPPELFNVSALITLFRIKKDAESSTKILHILKEAGYELKKGRRMNRNITRFSSFAEEEAIETGRDLEKIVKTYTPTEAASMYFLKKQKKYQSTNVLMNKLQRLPLFYFAVKYILQSDQTPLAFQRPSPNAGFLDPILQQKLGHLTWVTHGFSKTAYAGLADALKCMADDCFRCASDDVTQNGGDTFGSVEAYNQAISDAPTSLRLLPNNPIANQWQASNLSNAESNSRTDYQIAGRFGYSATNCQHQTSSYSETFNFLTNQSNSGSFNPLLGTVHSTASTNSFAYQRPNEHNLQPYAMNVDSQRQSFLYY